MRFQEILAGELKRRGWTSAQLVVEMEKAGYLKVKQYSVDKWLRGENLPSIPNACGLARVLDMTMDRLMGDDALGDTAHASGESDLAAAANA